MSDSSRVDSTGRDWFPRVGDKIIDHETGLPGVVLSVEQHASAPAVVICAIRSDPPSFVERLGPAPSVPSGISRDTSDDVSLPSFAECRADMTDSEAASLLLRNVVELGFYRSRISDDDGLVSALEMEVHRCIAISATMADRGRYDLAAREREAALHLRQLAAAVSFKLAQTDGIG
jgi:hypothetical protein